MSTAPKVSGIYDLTPMQEGMLLRTLLEPDGAAYIESFTVRIEGELDQEKWNEAFQLLINRHEALRTTFLHQKVAKPRQVILQERKALPSWVDLSNSSDADHKISALIAADRSKPFDLTKDVLLRMTVVKRAANDYQLLWAFHHIIMDGWCFTILLKEFMHLYQGLLQANKNTLPLPIPYSVYLKWLNNQNTEVAQDYWQQKLSRFEDASILPYYQKQAPGDFQFLAYDIEWNVIHTEGIKKFIREHQVSLNVYFQSLWALYLQKTNRSQQAVYGTVVSGRPSEIKGVENIIGLFINTVLIAVESQSDDRFVDLMLQMQQEFLMVNDHAYFPLSDAISMAPQHRLDHLLVFENIDQEVDKGKLTESTLKITDFSFHEQTDLDFDLSISPMSDSILLRFSYNATKFATSDVEAMARQFTYLSEQALQDKQLHLSEFKLLDHEAQKSYIDRSQSNTKKPIDQTVAQLLSATFESHASKIAVRDFDRAWTYEEFRQAISGFQHEMLKSGIQSGDVVAIYHQPCLELYAAIFALLYCGAVYLPIDRNYPYERVDFMLSDSQSSLVITDRIDLNLPVIDPKSIAKRNDVLQDFTNLNDPAYIIYTSGTTGQPKGVVLTHLNLADYCWELIQFISLNDMDCFIQQINLSFDASIEELFTMPLIGGSLFCVNHQKDLELIVNAIESGHPTILSASPQVLAYLNEQMEQPGNLRIILSGGEELKAEQIDKFHDQITIWNGYGPTEATVAVSFQKIIKQKAINIGVCLPNRHPYVLNQQRQLMPDGIAGELAIGGIALAKGYLNQPELSASKFIDHPFIQGEKLYLTGDLVRFNPEGELDFFGRIDQQVKIRGFRIELGEIEQVLLETVPELKQLVVSVRKSGQNDQLVAYHTGEISTDQVKQKLADRLPEYMQPDFYIHIESIPLTPSGKTDLKALPLPEAGANSQSIYEAPKGQLEEKLAEIWQQILGIDKVGRNDHFFERGGHSLKAMTLASRIHKEFEVKLPLQQLFAHPVLHHMALLLDVEEKSAFVAIKANPAQDDYPLSGAQKRLWLLNQIQGETSDYNVTSAWTLAERPEAELLKGALDFLSMRHQSLRCNFVVRDTEPRVVVNETPHYELIFNEANSDEEIKTIVLTEKNHVFNLEHEALCRVCVINHPKGAYVQLCAHHIITDGWSMEILENELKHIYTALKQNQEPKLDSLPVQYTDYAIWQQNLLEGDALGKLKAYWENQLSGDLPQMVLPTERSHSALETHEGNEYTHVIELNTSQQLWQLSETENNSLFMVMLAAFKLLMFRLTGEADVIIGTPVAGRGQKELDGIIGFFLNTVMLRHRFDPQSTLHDFLKENSSYTLEALQNQDYPFELLVEDLKIPRDLNRFPISGIFFNMVNFKEASYNAINQTEPQHRFHTGKVKFDLNVYVARHSNGIALTWSYKNELFQPSTIEVFARQYSAILTDLDKKMHLPVQQLLTGVSAIVRQQEFYPELQLNKNILDYWKQQVSENPDLPAVQTEKSTLTYLEAEKLSNRLANYLLKHGQRGNRVALLLEQTEWLVVSILAVLKAGMSYVPLDAEYPLVRLQKMLDQTQPSLLLGIRGNKHQSLSSEIPVVLIDELNLYADQPEVAPTNIISPDQEAYVLFTSGSSGEPKGVIQTHRGLCYFATQYAAAIGMKKGHRVSGLSSPSFDSFNHELFPSWVVGATYFPASLRSEISLNELSNWIERHQIQVFQTVPTVFRQWPISNKLASLEIVKMTGEASTLQDFEHFKKMTEAYAKFCVSYGATENSLSCITFYDHDTQLSQRQHLSPGFALQQTEISIQDELGHQLDYFQPGEICISSPGLATGYLLQDEEQRFQQNDYLRFYKSGDRGYIDHQGIPRILGRKDGQIKIRGMRIDLAEIEAALRLLHPEKQVVVALRSISGAERLTAYLTGSEVDRHTIKEQLQNHLPAHLIPEAIVFLDQLPQTESGKTNRRILVEPTVDDLIGTGQYHAPSSETEKELVRIWENLLHRKPIGIYDSFFDLGGNSLSASGLVAQIAKSFNKTILLRDFFSHPDIHSLARLIEQGVESHDYTNILPVGAAGLYAISPAQQRMFVLQELNPQSTAYNMTNVLRLRGALVVNKVRSVFEQLTQRHESLRTRFCWQDGTLMQEVLENAPLDFQFKKIKASELKEQLSLAKMPFDTAQAPLWRIRLFQLEELDFVLYTDMHHSISDGTSVGILTQEFVALYAGQALAPVPVQYKDFSAWMQQEEQQQKLNRAQAFWLKQFEGEIPVLDLPADYVRPSEFDSPAHRISLEVKEEVLLKFKHLLQSQKATLYMGLLSVLHYTLARFSGQSDLVVGSPIAGRKHADIQHTIGMFVNTLAFRQQVDMQRPFSDLLNANKALCLEAFEQANFPFSDLVELLNPLKDFSRNALFDVAFVLQNAEAQVQSLGDLKAEGIETDEYQAKFDLTLIAVENQRLILTFEYATAIYAHESMEQFARVFEQVIHSIVSNPELPLNRLPLAQSTAQFANHQIQEQTVQQHTESLSQLFEKQVSLNPGALAIRFDKQSLTYGQLNQKANQLAHALIQKGIKPGQVVALLLSRGMDQIVSILAILKCGAAYLPLAPDTPNDRISFMLSDSEAVLLIQEEQADFGIPTCLIHTIDFSALPDTNPTNSTTAKDLAYVIYTSGSTGLPKGTLIEQASVSRVVCHTNYISIVPEDRLLQLSNYAFDGSVFDIFGALLNGASLIIPTKEESSDLSGIADLIKDERVSISFMTTALFNTFMDEYPDRLHGLRKLLFGGERCSVNHIRKALRALGTDKLIHVYGPTESTVFATAFPIHEAAENVRTIPIGKTISNTLAVVLDENRLPVPIGAKGELYLGGLGLAREYLNQDELNAKSFYHFDFLRGERFYKTGDLVRQLANGNIEFLDRADHQVKIRGFRIELGEIEQLIRQADGVQDCLVRVYIDADQEKILLAYFTGSVPQQTLKDMLRLKLPAFMVPEHILHLNEFPLNRNGKIDTQKLPLPQQENAVNSEAFEAPETETEQALAQIWKELLKAESVGNNSHFFELGGHSLRAMVLINRIYQQFGIRLALGAIFEFPLLKDFAKLIEDSSKGNTSEIPKAQRLAYYPVSAAQKRMFLLQLFDLESTAYNIPLAFVLKGNMDKEHFAETFHALIARHECLRTVFAVKMNEPAQIIRPRVPFEMESEEIGNQDLNQTIAEFVRPFDLQKAPLMRVKLLKLKADEHLLMMDFHHIIADGASMPILFSDFMALYSQKDLPEIRIHYKDFAVWQDLFNKSEAFAKQEAFWLNLYQEDARNKAIPLISLPYDFERPNPRTFVGTTIDMSIDSSVSERINELAQNLNCTPYMLFLSGLNLLIYSLNQQQDIVIGSPVSGRTHPDLLAMPGMFVNTLPLRFKLEEQMALSDFLTQVKNHCIEAFECQDYPFDQLVETLDLPRDPSRNPLFDVLFTQQNFDFEDNSVEELSVSAYHFENNISKFDLAVTVLFKQNHYVLDFRYNTDLFKEATIKQFMESYLYIMKQLTDLDLQTSLSQWMSLMES